MKVLLCTTQYASTVTGAGSVARMIGAWETYSPGIEVIVLSEDLIEETASIRPVATGSLSRIPGMNYLRKSKWYADAVHTLLKKEHVDVILWMDIWLAHAFVRQKVNQPPSVAFMHDDNTLDMPGALQWTGRSLAFFVRWLLESRTVPFLRTIITNSDYLTTAVRQHFRKSNDVNRLYYAGRDYHRIELAQIQPPVDKVRMLFVKSDFMRGGLQDVLAALRSLGDFRFWLTIVGPDEVSVRRKLEPALLAQNHIDVVFAGEVSDWNALVRLYQSHHLFCVPSRREALGLANAEALMCGLPVVSTTAGGIPEVLDPAYALLSAPGDIEALAANIRDCVEHFDDALDRTDRGRDIVASKFSTQSMFARLEVILKDRVGNSPG